MAGAAQATHQHCRAGLARPIECQSSATIWANTAFEVVFAFRRFCLPLEVPSFRYDSEVKTASAREIFIFCISGHGNYAKLCEQAAMPMTSGLVQRANLVSLEFCDIVLPNLETGRGGFHDVGA